MKNLIGILLLMTISSSAFAVGTRGGGNVIVCFQIGEKRLDGSVVTTDGYQAIDQQGRLKNVLIRDNDINFIESIESLDLAEAKNLIAGDAGGKIIEIGKDESVENYVARILSPFSGIGSAIKEKIESTEQILPYSKMIPKPYGVYPVNDFTTIGPVDTSRCVLSSLVVQETLKDAEYFYRDQRLWTHKKISKQTKASVYVHELVYYIYRKAEEETSDVARKIVGLLITNVPGRTYRDLFSEVESLQFVSRTKVSLDWAIYPTVKRISYDLYKDYSKARDEYLAPIIREIDSILTENQIWLGDFSGHLDPALWSYWSPDKDRRWKKIMNLLQRGGLVSAANDAEELDQKTSFFLLKPHKPKDTRDVFVNVSEELNKKIRSKFRQLQRFNFWKAMQGPVLRMIEEKYEAKINLLDTLTSNDKAALLHWYKDQTQRETSPPVNLKWKPSNDIFDGDYVDAIGSYDFFITHEFQDYTIFGAEVPQLDLKVVIPFPERDFKIEGEKK